MSTVRLAYFTLPAVDNTLAEAPTIRLAHSPGAHGDGVLQGVRGVAPLSRESAPALLVSYVFLKPFLERQAAYVYRDWVLDSGAFSAYMSGTVIDLTAYIETCRELLATDPTLTEVYALDVIGDWRGTVRNTEAMWAAGVPAIPAFHGGEPWDVLVALARDYPKVALGGVAYAKVGLKLAWARQCFARVWPKRLHGFGFGGARAILALPFHSVDATNWEIGPCKFGNWRSFGGGNLSVRGSRQNLRSEVEWYLDLERRARERWRKEMAELEAATDGPVVRLAVVTAGTRTASGLGGPG